MTTSKAKTLEYSPGLVQKYVLIRDALDSAKKAFDTETKRMKEAMVKIEGILQKKLNEDGSESVVTEFGTFFTKNRSSVSVKDRDEFYQWAVGTDNLGAVDMKANAKTVRELLADGVEVPGVKYSEAKIVNVRRK
jgi:hypothetical protein